MIPKRMSSIRINQQVLILRITQFMVIHIVILVRVRKLFTFFRNIIMRIIKTIILPRRAAKFHPIQLVSQFFFRRNIHYINSLPVTSGIRHRVSQFFPVLRKSCETNRSRSRCRKSIRVQKNFLSSVNPLFIIINRLVLQPAVLRIIIVFARPRRSRYARKII